MQNADDYNANPASLGKSNGPWTTSAEMTNGRGAMVGLVSMLLAEKMIGGPITGVFGGDGSDELFANNYYDESFASQVETPAAKPAAFADFDATVVAPAPVAAEPPPEPAARRRRRRDCRAHPRGGRRRRGGGGGGDGHGPRRLRAGGGRRRRRGGGRRHVSGTPVTTHFLPLRGMGPEESARAN